MGFSTTTMTFTLLLFVTAVHGFPYYPNWEEISPFNDDLVSLDTWIDESVNSFFTIDNTDGKSSYELDNQNDLPIKQYEDTDDSTEETKDYVEDDMITPLTKTRNGLKTESDKWPNGVIPYKIIFPFSKADKKLINAAMEEFHKNTCIRFTPHKGKKGDFLRVRPNQFSCDSDVGRQGGRQDLNLSYRCTRDKGRIIHELMHTIGFYHEQCRPDRDNYIEIKWDNIRDDKKRNFMKYNETQVDDFGVGYDYESVMHYGPTSFSHNDQPTIVVKGNNNVKIGQRKGLSVKDIQKIRKMYNCQ